MEEFKDWGMDKPEFIKTGLIYWILGLDKINLFVDIYYKLLTEIDIIGIPETKEWLALYNPDISIPSKIKDVIIKLIKEDNKLINSVILYFKENIESQDNKLTETIEMMCELNFITRDEKTIIIDKYISLNSNHYENDFLNEIPKLLLQLIIDNPVFLFIVKIYIPCCIYYNADVKALYIKASDGDFDYIEKLIRIDKLIIHDEKIAEHVNVVLLNPRHMEYKKIKNALKGNIRNVSKKKLKTKIIGFNKACIEAQGYRVSYKELLDLLDRREKYIKRDEYAIDHDWEEDLESFAKNVKRETNKMKLPRNRTKK